MMALRKYPQALAVYVLICVASLLVLYTVLKPVREKSRRITDGLLKFINAFTRYALPPLFECLESG